MLRLAANATAAVALVFGAGAQAEIVQDYRKSAHYPARVSGIQFGERWLRANSPVSIGGWTVSFEGNSARARYTSYASGWHVSIYDMSCTHPDVSTERCYFTIGSIGCGIGPLYRGPGAKMQSFSVRCPVAVDFDR
jgi:hypothetical protein